MNIKSRLLKLEKESCVDIDFDINRSFSEWSRSELNTYLKSIGHEYIPPDLSGLSMAEIKAITIWCKVITFLKKRIKKLECLVVRSNNQLML